MLVPRRVGARSENASMNKLVTNLRHLMRMHVISEEQLSRNTRVPQSTLHRILAGRMADPCDGTLRPLATWFGITLEQLRTDLPDPADAAEGTTPYRIGPATGLAIRERSRDMAVAEVSILAVAPAPGHPVDVLQTDRGLPFTVMGLGPPAVAGACNGDITHGGQTLQHAEGLPGETASPIMRPWRPSSTWPLPWPPRSACRSIRRRHALTLGPSLPRWPLAL